MQKISENKISRLRNLGQMFQGLITHTEENIKKLPISSHRLRIEREFELCKKVFDGLSTTIQTCQALNDFCTDSLKTNVVDIFGLTHISDWSIEILCVYVNNSLAQLDRLNAYINQEVSKNG